MNFRPECFVFGLLSLEEPTGQSDLFHDALRSQHIYIAKLVFRLAEVLHLDPAFVDQGVEAVVQAAGADTQALSDVALGQVGVFLQHAQDPEIGVFLKLRAAAGH